MITKNRVVRSSIWFIVTSVLLNGINVITAPIFTKLLSTSEYGQISNFNTWASILSAVLGLGLSYTITNAEVDKKNCLNEYIGNIVFLSLVVILSFGLIVSIFYKSAIEVTELTKELLWLIVPFIFFNSLLGMVQIKYVFEGEIKKNAIISIVPVLVSVFMSIILILYAPVPKSLGKIIGNCVPTFVMGMGYSVFYLSKVKLSSFVDDYKYALRISLPMIPHGLAIILLGQIDRIMIIKRFGDSDAGVYSFAYTVGMLISIVSIAINKAFQPWMFELYQKDKRDVAKKSGRTSTILVFFGIAIYCMVIPEVLHILADKKFWGSLEIIYPVTVAAFCQYVYGLYAYVEQFYKKTVYIAIGTIIAATANYIFNLFLMPLFGYKIAAITTLLGYLLLMIYHFIACRMVTKNNVYNIGLELLLLCILIVISAVSYALAGEAVIRWMMAIMLFAIVLVKYKKIIYKVI